MPAADPRGCGPRRSVQARDWCHDREHRPQSEHRTVLLRGGDVHSPADPFATAMVVERGHVAWVGSEGAADAFASGVDEVIDLEGALVTPAFTDAHVHTTSSGLALTGLDLSAARTLAEALDLVRAHTAAHPADRVVLGHGWDATRWPEQRPRRAANSTRRPAAGPSICPGSMCTPRSSPQPSSIWCPASPRWPATTPTPRSPTPPTTRCAPPRTEPSRRGSAPTPSARPWTTPPRSVSAPSMSAADPTSPTRRTSPDC